MKRRLALVVLIALCVVGPAYAVYSEDADPKIVTPALAGLRRVGAAQQGKRTRRARPAE